MRFSAALVLVCCATSMGLAQDVTVSRSNKTVEVTVTATVEADPEVAVLSLGHEDYGRTHEAAFGDNVRAADRIVQALGQAGVPKANIETQRLTVDRTQPDEKWTAEERTKNQFSASQSWELKVGVADAQRVLDAAVNAGANEVTDVDWQVKDIGALDARATEAALDKARKLAGQIAAGLGAKLGELLYASNTVRQPKGWPFGLGVAQASLATAQRREPELKLFPKKVEQEATVHAIFAID